MCLTNNQLIEKYQEQTSFYFTASELVCIPGELKVLQEINPVRTVILNLKSDKDGRRSFILTQDGYTVGRLRIPDSSYGLLLRSAWYADKPSWKRFANQ